MVLAWDGVTPSGLRGPNLQNPVQTLEVLQDTGLLKTVDLFGRVENGFMDRITDFDQKQASGSQPPRGLLEEEHRLCR